MPITEDNELSKLLAGGHINALSVDTNIFDEKGLQLNSAALLAVSKLAALHFDFLLSGTVAREIKRHLEQSATEAMRGARKAIGIALTSHQTASPTRDQILDQISGGQTPTQASEKQFADHLAVTNCRVLNDAEHVDTSKIFDAYFAVEPPFGAGAKKSEFPDALALFALEDVAVKRGKDIIIVSKDKDWNAYCETSKRLHLVPDIERALSLMNDPPAVLRAALRAWLTDGDGKTELDGYISQAVERIDFSVIGTASSGEMDANAWAGELRQTEWPDPDDIDIIEIDTLIDSAAGNTDDEEIAEGETGRNSIDVTLSIPLSLTIRVPIEIEFSVWDSVDRESVGMGGRTVEHDEEIYVRANVDIKVHDLGGDSEQFDIVSFQLDIGYVEIDLGELDVFEPHDYDRE